MNKKYMIQGHKHTDYVLSYLMREYPEAVLENPEWTQETDPQWWYYVGNSGVIHRVSDMDENNFKLIRAFYNILANVYENPEEHLYERTEDEFKKFSEAKLFSTFEPDYYETLDACPGSWTGDIKGDHSKAVEKLSGWLDKYKTSKPAEERLSIYPIIMKPGSLDNGAFLLVNGLNGHTRLSKDSLPHVLDCIKYIENHWDARAWIDKAMNHSDVYYYLIRFVIWGPKKKKS